MTSDSSGPSGQEYGANTLRLAAGEGCTVLKRKAIRLQQSSDNELVIYHMRSLLNEAGFHTTDEFILAAAASELATNIVRYTPGGMMEICLIRDAGGRTGVEVFASDKGPGIPDLEAAMREHYSSEPGSLGMGLPSVKRIMDEFAIESVVGAGTRVRARKWRNYGQD
ncbi:MAG: anti-sigma regulatory factor [Eubacteriales bacterium]|nr:anti-sigma regulatory factor [Eubacteriales bacterium]